jgi:prophage regulatory protein
MIKLEKILRLNEVLEMTGLSRTTIWRLMKEGKFPKSKKISAHTIGFLSTDIENWLAMER